MPNLAENQGFQDPVDTTGLEDFFSSHDTPSQEDLTLDEAAKRLNLSERTIQRRLKAGQLVGYKVPGPRGPEWRVTLKALDDTTETAVPSTDDATAGSPDMTVIAEMSSDDTTKNPHDIAANAVFQMSDFYRDQIETLQEKLEAATFRNGYLEAQLSNVEIQLKLLPDLSAKAVKAETLEQQNLKLQNELEALNRGWFSRFSKWFLGKP